MPNLAFAMTRHPLPDTGALIELTAGSAPGAVTPAPEQPLHGVRVVQAEGPTVTVSMAITAVPAEGAPVILRWPAGPRGRYVQSGTVAGVEENRITVTLTGAPDVEQKRNYVRAGGGEPVLLRRSGEADTSGWIRDISEQSVRAHFTDVVVCEGDDLTLHIELDDTVVQVPAVATKVASMRQSLPQRGPLSVELVAMFTADETQARVIRRYVLQQQLLARTRAAT
jgi:hypothetical protein